MSPRKGLGYEVRRPVSTVPSDIGATILAY